MPTFQQLSQKELKLYSSLKMKKYREQYGMFVAEGQKVVEETISFFEVVAVLSSSEERINDLKHKHPLEDHKVRITGEREMERLSALDKGRDLIAVYNLPETAPLPENLGLCVALDSVQNPGNMGTIIRLCDWLGVRHLLCGEGCVDIYNPKVVQATAGALGSVVVHENVVLKDVLPQHFKIICGTKMEGIPIGEATQYNPDNSLCILFGNEGHGISQELQDICTDFYAIPAAPSSTTESLNVGISAAIILSKFIGLT